MLSKSEISFSSYPYVQQAVSQPCNLSLTPSLNATSAVVFCTTSSVRQQVTPSSGAANTHFVNTAVTFPGNVDSPMAFYTDSACLDQGESWLNQVGLTCSLSPADQLFITSPVTTTCNQPMQQALASPLLSVEQESLLYSQGSLHLDTGALTPIMPRCYGSPASSNNNSSESSFEVVSSTTSPAQQLTSFASPSSSSSLVPLISPQGSAAAGEAPSAGLCKERTSGSNRPKRPRGRYKHVPHKDKPRPVVAKRNARERRRVQTVNGAFTLLRKHIPYEPKHRRLSKVKTLRIAISYISQLRQLLHPSSNDDSLISQQQQVQCNQWTLADYDEDACLASSTSAASSLQSDGVARSQEYCTLVSGSTPSSYYSCRMLPASLTHCMNDYH